MLYVTVCCVLFMFWDPSATPLMLLFQVHKSFLPLVFSRFGSFRSGPVYSSIYLEIFVGARTCKCRVALPVLNVGFLCVGLFVSLCFSCAFSPPFFFVFLFLLFDMSNCRGKTYCKSFYCTVGCFLSFGRQVLLQWTCLPDLFSQSGLPCGGGWQWDIWWVTDHRPPPRPHLSVCCIIVRLCVNQMSVWAIIPMPVFALDLPPYRPTSAPSSPPPVGLSE